MFTVEHHIDILPETQTFKHRLHCAGPSALQEIANQVDKILLQDVVEPAQYEETSPVVLA